MIIMFKDDDGIEDFLWFIIMYMIDEDDTSLESVSNTRVGRPGGFVLFEGTR